MPAVVIVNKVRVLFFAVFLVCLSTFLGCASHESDILIFSIQIESEPGSMKASWAVHGDGDVEFERESNRKGAGWIAAFRLGGAEGFAFIQVRPEDEEALVLVRSEKPVAVVANVNSGHFRVKHDGGDMDMHVYTVHSWKMGTYEASEVDH